MLFLSSAPGVYDARRFLFTYFRSSFAGTLKSNYDGVARYYDRLSRMIFGKKLVHSQACHLGLVPPGSSLLIVGGGSGYVLETLAAIHPAGLQITYVDASAEMISLARKRFAGKNKVTFIEATIESVTFTDEGFDVVITQFFFDNFSRENARQLFARLGKALNPTGIWIYSDFSQTEIGWQKALLGLMYWFFRLFCHIEASQLPDMQPVFIQSGYYCFSEKKWLSGFITACVYKRKNSADDLP